MKKTKNTYDKLDLKYLQVYEYGKEHKNRQNILFIHGFYIDHRCFEPIYQIMSKTHKCICFNLPGCGDDSKLYYPKKYLSFETMAKLITKYIIENDLNNLIIIGHSLGGAIATLVNYELKNTRIEKLILLAPYSLASIPNVVNKIFIFHIKNKEKFENLQKNLFTDYTKALNNVGEDKERYFKEFESFNKRNQKYMFPIMFRMSRLWSFKRLNDGYRNIKVPLYIFLGSKDKFVDIFMVSKYLTTQINDDIEIYPYKNLGHAFFIENHKQFIKDLRKIIKNEKK